MGVQVELPTLRKKRLLGSSKETSPVANRVQKQLDHESWQWGAFDDLPIETDEYDCPLSPPTFLSEKIGAGAATLAGSPNGSLDHLISPSPSGSISESPSSPRSISPSFRGGMCADPFASSTNHRRLRKGKKSDGHKDSKNSMAFDCKSGSRWDSDRRRGGNRFEEGVKCGKGHKGNGMCKCAAGLTAEVAVVCCCPFALLHLLVIAFIKLPAAVVARTISKMKQQCVEKRNRVTVREEDDEMNTPASSYAPSRCNSYEAPDVQTWVPTLSFGDQKMWRDCFDSPDYCSGRPTRAKS